MLFTCHLTNLAGADRFSKDIAIMTGRETSVFLRVLWVIVVPSFMAVMFDSFKITPLTQYYEPPNDKTNKMTGRPAKTQISLGIRPVWSESSLCWVAEEPMFLHADSEDSDQTGRIKKLQCFKNSVDVYFSDVIRIAHCFAKNESTSWLLKEAKFGRLPLLETTISSLSSARCAPFWGKISGVTGQF